MRLRDEGHQTRGCSTRLLLSQHCLQSNCRRNKSLNVCLLEVDFILNKRRQNIKWRIGLCNKKPCVDILNRTKWSLYPGFEQTERSVPVGLQEQRHSGPTAVGLESFPLLFALVCCKKIISTCSLELKYHKTTFTNTVPSTLLWMDVLYVNKADTTVYSPVSTFSHEHIRFILDVQ